ncbi:hypothetical protein [Lentilitoribacter sp. EG35]|uniref:hypothetical protein n=1 Tax=Lentilitoribacter sp. EG35 TaxID=3234192 RepID=UPI0034605D76
MTKNKTISLKAAFATSFLTIHSSAFAQDKQSADISLFESGLSIANDILTTSDAVASGIGKQTAWGPATKITGPLGDANKALRKLEQSDYSGAIATGLGGVSRAPLIGAGAAWGTATIPVPVLGTAIGAGVGYLVSYAVEKYAEASGNAVLRLRDRNKPDIIRRLEAAKLDYITLAKQYDFCSDVEKLNFEINIRQALLDNEAELARLNGASYIPDQVIATEIDILEDQLIQLENSVSPEEMFLKQRIKNLQKAKVRNDEYLTECNKNPNCKAMLHIQIRSINKQELALKEAEERYSSLYCEF